MLNRKTWATATGALILGAGLTGCGGTSSSTAAGSGSPTDASKASFCRLFTELGSDTKPQDAADRLSQIGTPSGISSGARHGFEVLVDRLRELPDKVTEGAITQMTQGLTGRDRTDVMAFVNYYSSECNDLPSGAPTG